MSSAF